MAKENKIAETLNMRPIDEAKEDLRAEFEATLKEEQLDLPVIRQETLPAIQSDDKNAEENLKDIELAKANIENIINLGDDAVKEMVAIAKQSESPRAFEVVSTLMKTLLDANKDYVEMSTKKRYAKEEQTTTQNVTNNNLIVSTADLLKMIKDGNE